jgi:hypothetical protein
VRQPHTVVLAFIEITFNRSIVFYVYMNFYYYILFCAHQSPHEEGKFDVIQFKLNCKIIVQVR